MKWFENTKISKKLIVSFLIVALLAVAIGVVGIISISNIKDADNTLYSEHTMSLQYAGEAGVVFMQIRYNCLSLLNLEATDVETINSTSETLYNYFSQLTEILGELDNTLQDEDIRVLLEQIQEGWAQYEPFMDQIIQNKQNNLDVTLDNSMVEVGSTQRDDFLTIFTQISSLA